MFRENTDILNYPHFLMSTDPRQMRSNHPNTATDVLRLYDSENVFHGYSLCQATEKLTLSAIVNGAEPSGLTCAVNHVFSLTLPRFQGTLIVLEIVKN